MSQQSPVQAPNGVQVLRQRAYECVHPLRPLTRMYERANKLHRYDQKRWEIARKKASLKRELESAEEQIERFIQAFIVEERRKASEMIQKKLPREIRDMVYEYLYLTGGRVCVKQYLHLLGRYNSQIVQEPCLGQWQCGGGDEWGRNTNHFDAKVVNALWNGVCSEWMSSSAMEATTKELNELLLRVSSAEFYENYSLIRSFLDMKIPELGLTPASSVRHASVTLPHLFPKDGVESILEHLRSLLKLEYCVVDFWFRHYDFGGMTDEDKISGIANLRKCLEAFFPFFIDLKEAGYRRVIVRAPYECKVDSSETSDFTPEGLMSRILGGGT